MKTVFTSILIVLALLAAFAVSLFLLEGNADGKNERIAKQAVSANDPDVCDQLPVLVETPPRPDDAKGVNYKDYQRDDCLLTYLTETKDDSICDRFETHGSYCYKFIAEVYEDPEVCEGLLETDSAHWKSIPICRAVALRDASECDVLDKPSYAGHGFYPQTACIIEVVKRTRDVELCLDIKDLPEGTKLYPHRDACIKIAGCDKPKQRENLCSLIEFPENMLDEEKRLCLSEDWRCPEVPSSI